MLTGEAVQGIVYHGQLADNVFHLTYGNSRRCDVRLDVSRNEIKATVAGEVHSSANGTVHALAFPLENDGACLKARIARSPEAVSGTIGAKEIAEIIVTGVIRGRFQ